VLAVSNLSSFARLWLGCNRTNYFSQTGVVVLQFTVNWIDYHFYLYSLLFPHRSFVSHIAYLLPECIDNSWTRFALRGYRLHTDLDEVDAYQTWAISRFPRDGSLNIDACYLLTKSSISMFMSRSCSKKSSITVNVLINLMSYYWRDVSQSDWLTRGDKVRPQREYSVAVSRR